MEWRGWTVESTHGNAFQKGLPDLYLWHPDHLQRWVDVKNAGAYRFTADQCRKWTKWEKNKLGVWIMVAATEEEYAKLWQPPNFRQFWKPHYDQYLLDVEEIIDEIRLDNQ